MSFGYGDKPVLKDVSFTVPQGSVLGIVGATGSGKSTIAGLAARLFEPDSGAIYIGDKNLAELSLATVRNNVGLVLQEGYVYSRTIRENIAMAAEEASDDKIRETARTVCLDKSIASFKDGYDTVVGERGVTLSGGQKQRLNIARALMKNTPVLIFDDSLSAVDSETDAEIRKNLKERFKGTTVIIISHRLTTVMDADNIIVLDDGVIAESGTNAELLAKGGIYSKIYQMQTALPDELKGGAL